MNVALILAGGTDSRFKMDILGLSSVFYRCMQIDLEESETDKKCVV